MQRKWRTNRSALDTVVSYPDFRASIPPRDSDYSLADPTDLYSVYTVLHIESKQAELRWSPQGRFYYFLAQWEQAETTESQPQQHAAAPEGDEDPPPQIVPEGSAAALQQEAAAAERDGGGGKGADRHTQQQQRQQLPEPQQAGAPRGTSSEPEQQQQQQQQQGAAPASADSHQQAPEAVGAAAAVDAAAALPPKLRTQILVPVSSACRQLTPRLLQRLFAVRGVQAQQLLLALVDSNGVVTRSCLYNYIQAPLEGPGTANLELLDD